MVHLVHLIDLGSRIFTCSGDVEWQNNEFKLRGSNQIDIFSSSACKFVYRSYLAHLNLILIKKMLNLID